MISNRLHDNIVVLKTALSDNINRVKGYILCCAKLKKKKFSADLNKSGPQSFFDSFWNEGKRVERSCFVQS